MVLSGGRLAKETNNEGGVKDFTVTPITDEDDKIHNAQDVNVVNSNDIEVKLTGEGIAQDETLTDGSQKTKWVDESDNVLGGNTPAKVDVSSFPALNSNTDSVTSVNQPAASIGHGIKNVTTAGTDVALANSTPCKYVIIQARFTNTSFIAVGGSGVDCTTDTGTGIKLEAGDGVTLDVDNLADVYIDSLVNGEGVRFTYGVA